MSSVYSIRCFVSSIILVTAIFVLTQHSLSACDTPVYRYAMARWAASRYQVYFIHEGPISNDDRQVRKKIVVVSDDKKRRTNVLHVSVSLKDGVLPKVPKAVQSAWSDGRDRAPPYYMVVSPQGKEIFGGRIAPDEVGPLLDSPARRRIINQLLKGKAAVLVLLTGKDAKANSVAEREVVQTAKEINRGRILLKTAKSSQQTPDRGKDKTADKKPPHQVGFVKLSRTDKRERWLVRMLLAAESDLNDQRLQDQPMVFAVFGQGRVLPPYIGKGVTRRNLIECIEFVSGPCACTVKEQNPGIDLLLRSNWSIAATDPAPIDAKNKKLRK